MLWVFYYRGYEFSYLYQNSLKFFYRRVCVFLPIHSPLLSASHRYLTFSIIIFRCAKDQTVQFLTATNNRQRFSLQAFRYLQNSTAVFVHCLVFMCHKTSPDSRCSSGCQGNNVNRVRRDIDRKEQVEDIKYYLLEREVRLARPGGKVSFNMKTLCARGGKIRSQFGTDRPCVHTGTSGSDPICYPC